MATVKKKKYISCILSPFVCAGSAKPQTINRAVGCVCHPSKTPEINGAVGRCPSKISGTRRVLDKQPSRAPGRAWGWVNCWEEAVATVLQLAVLHALEAASDPNGGAESGVVRLNLH